MDLMTEVAGFEQRAAAFRERANPEVAAATVDQGLRIVAGKLSHMDRSLISDDTLDRVRQIEADAYDRDLEQRAVALDTDERALRRAVRAELDAAAECPSDPALAVKDDHVRLMAEMVSNQRKDAAVRQLTGKALPYVRDELLRTPDAKNSELVRLVEEQAARGFVDLALVPTKQDAEALMAIKDEIAKRRAARIKAHAPEALAVSERLESVTGGAVLDVLRRHVRSGRGVAATPKRRRVNIPLTTV